MFDFVQYALLGITLIVSLVFTWLGLLCIRTRSIGLIIITVVLVYPLTLDLIQSNILRFYIDQWVVGELSWWTPSMAIEEFLMLYKLVMRLIHDGLLVLGAFLIYQEWSRGKIRWNQQRSPEVVNHA